MLPWPPQQQIGLPRAWRRLHYCKSFLVADMPHQPVRCFFDLLLDGSMVRETRRLRCAPPSMADKFFGHVGRQFRFAHPWDAMCQPRAWQSRFHISHSFADAIPSIEGLTRTTRSPTSFLLFAAGNLPSFDFLLEARHLKFESIATFGDRSMSRSRSSRRSESNDTD